MVQELHVSITTVQWQGRGPEISSGVPRVIPKLGTTPTRPAPSQRLGQLSSLLQHATPAGTPMRLGPAQTCLIQPEGIA